MKEQEIHNRDILRMVFSLISLPLNARFNTVLLMLSADGWMQQCSPVICLSMADHFVNIHLHSIMPPHCPLCNAPKSSFGQWNSLSWQLRDYRLYFQKMILTTQGDKIEIVLAMVPGYPAAVRVWNRTRLSSPGCHPEYRGTQRVRGRVRTGLWFHFTVSTTLALIKYLSSHRIMTWSVHKLFSSGRSFTSRILISDPTDICWVAVEKGQIWAKLAGFQ